jgi:hypothetical protein
VKHADSNRRERYAESMNSPRLSVCSPVEEYERRVAGQSECVWCKILCCVAFWALAQSYAIVDYGLGQILRSQYDVDAAFTTTLIWGASVPCAMGAGLFALTNWSCLDKPRLLAGLLPWIVTTLEATALLWMLLA